MKGALPKNLLRAVLIVGCFLLSDPSSHPASRVTDYTSIFEICRARASGERYIAIRSFQQDGKPRYLVVNRETMQTAIKTREELRFERTDAAELASLKNQSPYLKMLGDCSASPYGLRNYGLTHFARDLTGAVFTADLCPSRRKLDRNLFTSLLGEMEPSQKPVPLVLAVSGKWIDNHEEDLRWLHAMEEQGRIRITWVNHSYNHPKTYKRAWKIIMSSFLLSPGTDMDFEVMATEKKMVENRLTPSVFFRFPGLISREDLVLSLRKHGLIALGSDAWLGRGEWPRNGSIILVHANGHEPVGIKRFFAFLSKQKGKIGAGEWRFLDITACIIHDSRITTAKNAIRKTRLAPKKQTS